jgi:hypothetical protein
LLVLEIILNRTKNNILQCPTQAYSIFKSARQSIQIITSLRLLRRYSRFIVLTYSPPTIQLQELYPGSIVLKLQDFMREYDLEKQVKDFWSSACETLVVQCNLAQVGGQRIQHAKYIIERAAEGVDAPSKKIVFVIHITHQNQASISLVYDPEWMCALISEIEDPSMLTFPSTIGEQPFY